MKKVISIVSSVGVFLFPVVVLAALNTTSGTSGNAFVGSGIEAFVKNLVTFINSTIVPLVFAIAFLVFLWGIFKTFILGGADETKRSEGRQLMLYAIIGFLLMVSLWGIVNLVSSSLGLSQSFTGSLPKSPSQ